MKTITKIISFVLLCGSFVGCTIVMPTPEANNTKDPSYTRPTPTTTVIDSPPSTRPRPNRGESTPAYTRPTPTSTAIKQGSDGRIDAPAGKHAETKSVADTTIQVRSRVRR